MGGAAITGSSRFEFDLVSGSGSGPSKNFVSWRGGAPRPASNIYDPDGTMQAAPFPESDSQGNGGETQSWHDGNSYMFSIAFEPDDIAPVDTFSFYDRTTPGGPTDWTLFINGDPVASGQTHLNATFNFESFSIAPLSGTTLVELVGTGATDPAAAWTIDDLELAISVPEPSSLALVGTAVGAFLWHRIWRRPTRVSRDRRANKPVQLRRGSGEDLTFMESMLFEAIHWRKRAWRPRFKRFRATWAFRRWLIDWGGRRGDTVSVAQINRKPVGAAWYRYQPRELGSCGFVDESIPEVCMGVGRRHRSRGVGRSLLGHLIEQARAAKIPALSLSVEPENIAARLYESFGFRQVGTAGGSRTLALEL